MDPLLWAVALWVDGVGLGQAPPALLGPHLLERVNSRLHGRVLDFTHNHGADRRVWSAALGEKRDLYVYVPPGFDPGKRYSLAIFLHGAAQDEQFFLQSMVIRLDRAIAEGHLPPMIVAAPDGSRKGHATIHHPATFWANSRAGNFEDYVVQDVWGFLFENFPLRPEREAHVLLGCSMGGSAAFALAIKHRDCFKVVIGFHPLLNLRHVDCRGHYQAPFDPCCAALRERMHGLEALGRRKFFVLRFNDLFVPLYGRRGKAVQGMAAINPLELMDELDLQPGELELFAGYGARDEFNVAAQVEGFLYHARRRGIEVASERDPDGRHNLATARRLLPAALEWASQRIPPPEEARVP